MDELQGVVSTAGGTFLITIRAATAEPQAPVPSAPPRPAIRKREAFPKTTRIRLLNAQEHRCAICRGPLGLYDSHIDHIVPMASGGSDDYSNLQLTHMSCNLRKGAGRGPYDPSQERMPWA